MAQHIQAQLVGPVQVLQDDQRRSARIRRNQQVGQVLYQQAAPVVGAATGAAVNLAFLEHFRGVAQAHFTVRRLEREYGAAPVRAAYDAVRPRSATA